MDFSTIYTRLHKLVYQTTEQFKYDLNLIWRNAKDYNPSSSQIHKLAIRLQKMSVVLLSHLQMMYPDVNKNNENKQNHKENQENSNKPAEGGRLLVGETIIHEEEQVDVMQQHEPEEVEEKKQLPEKEVSEREDSISDILFFVVAWIIMLYAVVCVIIIIELI